MLRILVTGIAGDIGSSVVKILAEYSSKEIIVGIDLFKYSAEIASVDFFYKAIPVSDYNNYKNHIVELISLHKINFIIPTTEKEISFFSDNRDFFSSLNVLLLIHSSNMINTFEEQLNTIKTLEKIGLKTPKIISITDDNFNYPVIFKTDKSSGGKGVFILENQDDFNYYTKKYPEGIAQEIIGDIDNEFTLTIFSNNKKSHYICFRRYLGYDGMSKFVELHDDISIKSISTQLLNNMNFIGSINVQLRRNKDLEYIIFEINPRLSSTLSFKHFFGFKDLIWWIESLRNQFHDITYNQNYDSGIGIKKLSEIYFNLKWKGLGHEIKCQT